MFSGDSFLIGVFLKTEAEDRVRAFHEAARDLQSYFESKGLSDVEVVLSDEIHRADQISGKFKHVYKDFQ